MENYFPHHGKIQAGFSTPWKIKRLFFHTVEKWKA
jgi:hypothetical protein